MDDEKINILNDFEEEIKTTLNNYRLQIKSFSIEDLMDVVFGNFGNCLDYSNLKRAKRQITLISTHLFHYAYSQENKPTKSENEKYNNHEKSLIKKIKEFKSLLWEKEELPNDKELHVLHYLLNKMMSDPYLYMKEPEETPKYVFTKGYIREKIIGFLSDRPDHRKCVNITDRALLQIGELLKNSE